MIGHGCAPFPSRVRVCSPSLESVNTMSPSVLRAVESELLASNGDRARQFREMTGRAVLSVSV